MPRYMKYDGGADVEVTVSVAEFAYPKHRQTHAPRAWQRVQVLDESFRRPYKTVGAAERALSRELNAWVVHRLSAGLYNVAEETETSAHGYSSTTTGRIVLSPSTNVSVTSPLRPFMVEYRITRRRH